MDTNTQPNEPIKIIEKSKGAFREAWNTLKFEIAYNLEVFKEKNFYLYLFAVSALVLVLFKQYIFAVFCLFILILLKFYFDHSTGIVKSYVRKSQGIPSRSDIKSMKEDNNATKLEPNS
jgi:hypothetical protein